MHATPKHRVAGKADCLLPTYNQEEELHQSIHKEHEVNISIAAKVGEK